MPWFTWRSLFLIPSQRRLAHDYRCFRVSVSDVFVTRHDDCGACVLIRDGSWVRRFTDSFCAVCVGSTYQFIWFDLVCSPFQKFHSVAVRLAPLELGGRFSTFRLLQLGDPGGQRLLVVLKRCEVAVEGVVHV